MISAWRAQRLARLGAVHFDVLIIGGGIVGAGTARDAAMRGLKVALIDQGDFASGTSSKTSKLIHGGLRYLEHGRLRLVFESLRERQILRTIAPTLVHPLRLMLPVYEDDARHPGTIRLGLALYDLLALGRNLRPHQMVSARRAAMLEPALRVNGLKAAGLFGDCQMDDARLCLANVLQAASFGAVCTNYVRLEAFLTANGRICGAGVVDRLTGRSLEVQARVTVNATGPWSDGVRRLSHVASADRLAPTKGIHLIVPRLTQEALFVQARADRRMLFILPWGEYSLVGTTETAVNQPLEDLRATPEDVQYLLEEVNRVLPGRHLAEDNLIATFAGARPLLAFEGSSTGASREHRIEVDGRGLISVMGGKYTTYRVMAQQVVDLLMRQQRWRGPGQPFGNAGAGDRCLTDQVSLLEAMQPVTLELWEQATRQVDPDTLARLLTLYGAGVLPILQLISREPALGRPICLHHEVLGAELIHGFQHELACTVTDVLARRTRIAWSSCQGLDTLSTVADIFQRFGGVSERGLTEQVAAYHQFLDAGLSCRPVASDTRRWAGDDTA